MSGTIYESGTERVRPGPEADNSKYFAGMVETFDEKVSLTGSEMFPFTLSDESYQISWDALKADIEETEWDELLFGKYAIENLKIDTGDPDDGMYELHVQNGDITMPHTIVTIENPSTSSANHETTLSQLIKSATRVILHDSALMDYSTTGMFYRLKNFSDAEYLGWEWDSYARVGGVMTKFIAARLDGEDGSLYLGGNLNPITSDAQNLGSEDEIWSNAFIGYVKAAAVKVTGSYRFDDGSTVFPGTTGTFTSADSKTITVQGGIITGIV